MLKQASDLLARVRGLRWRRGQIIARQRHAALLANSSTDLSDVLNGAGELRELLEDIKSDLALASREQSFDLEIYDYTVRALRDVSNRLLDLEEEQLDKDARLEIETLVKVVDDEELNVARAVRSVVKVGVYKKMSLIELAPLFTSITLQSMSQMVISSTVLRCSKRPRAGSFWTFWRRIPREMKESSRRWLGTRPRGFSLRAMSVSTP